MKNVRELCMMAPVIPVLVIEDLATAQPIAEALVKGGLPVLEITLRTPCALEAIRLMSEVPGAIVGVGTLLTPADVVSAKSAGASFGVSPGVTDALLDTVEGEQLALLPGAATASEVMRLLDRGYDTLKFFPAEAAGGVNMLKSFSGPLPQVSFCPTGGVNPQNVKEYLSLPNVLCVGGTWITTPGKILAKDWQGIQIEASFAATFGT
jgi:2-dehydro-3-deoxyphosphogluconate aldolase/(4S)-4-hydroxy-2-oxoglutarate aldolase